MVSEQDLVYLKILLISFVASFGVKRCPRRDIVSGSLGLFLVFYICGCQLFYSFTVVAINLAVINLLDIRYVHLVSFSICFAYLTFFRCAEFFGLPKALPYANGVQLIMTLRCVGLAFEVHDANLTNTKEDKILDRTKRATILDQFLYCYNFVGIFTGPYFSFRVHLDNVACQYLLSIQYANHLTSRILLFPCYIVMFFVAQALFPLEIVHSTEFYDSYGFLYRFCYMVPIFFQLRMRCYIAWTLSESACIVAGIGAYPSESKPKCGHGPTEIDKLNKFETKELTQQTDEGDEFSFETIKNIDPAGCEFSGTFRDAMRHWNRSVQYWLATYVYRRTPKSYNRAAVTMLVSAYWHGVHPGYYLSFMTIPLCLYVEDLMFSCFGSSQEKTSSSSKPKSWDTQLSTTFEKLWWFFRIRGFEYMAMGFLLLTWQSTIAYWKSIGFALHVCLIVLLIIGLTVKSVFGKARKRHAN